MDNNNNGNSNSGNDKQTITIVIILIAAIVIFFLVVAWCGFFYGLWRNRKVALDISRMEQHRRQQQYRRQQLLQHQQQQHNAPQQQQQLQQQLKKQQLRQQQLRQQQLRQQEHNANRSRPSSQLSPNPSHNNFTHQPQLNSYPQMPHHGERISVHSRYITPAAVAIPVFIPPRDYDDDNHDQTPLSAVAANSSVSSSGLDHSYHNRTFDYFEGPSSPNQSFTNIGYQSTVSYPDGMVGINQSNLRSGYSPASSRSTSTPLVPKMQAKHKRTSQPASFENYTSMEMQQYQQLQYWPQNY